MKRLLNHSELKRQLAGYMLTIMSSFRPSAPVPRQQDVGARQVATDIFQIITGRKYSHLSRGKARKYEETIVRNLEEDVLSEKPATFFYDLGPGYHASLYPGRAPLSFRIGLSELFALYQINEFSKDVSEIYPEGVQFFIVIDNLCALSTNEIPTEKTARYCSEFRGLIRDIGVQQRVQLLVESELFEETDYPRLTLPVPIGNTADRILSEEEIENVSRFLGRRCDIAEAGARVDIYREATEVTEKNLASAVTGVRLTQRATENTLGFRSFPGGDSRVQTGEVVLSQNKKGRFCPILLTSRNVGEYDQYRFEPPDEVPDSIQHLTYVRSAGY